MRDAEALGLGTAFISERYDLKEAATLCGAAGAVSERIHIQTATTNHNTRHPMVTAGIARTMQDLTGGRFVLGIGRGIPAMQDAFGMSRITTAQMEDFVGIMRRLFRGEVVVGHDGPAGSWPVLHLNRTLDEHLPMGLVAFGPESLKLGGRCFDEVVLHTFFTDETTARAVRTVKESAEQAGRDPDDVVVWSCFATTEQLEDIATLLPDEWLAPSATGTPEQCASAVRGQLALGCDAVILHGATPTQLQPVVDAYRAG